MSHGGLDGFLNLSVSSPGTSVSANGAKGKKRSVRAYHTDFSPSISGTSTPVDSVPFNTGVPPSYSNGSSTPASYNGSNTMTASYNGTANALNGVNGTSGGNLNANGADFSTTEALGENLSVCNRRFNDQWEYMTPYEGDVACKQFLTFQNVVSPTAGTQFQTVDQGTAAAKFMRSTMYNIPETDQLRQASKLPVAVTIRPFAPLLSTEEPIPVVDMRETGKGFVEKGEEGPIRCRRCRTYMNPSIQHAHGNKFTCNICQFPNNTVPQDYSSMLNPATNQRVDQGIRPELHKGVYDILVPSSYNIGGELVDPQPLHHVFLIDITVASVKHNLPTLLADTIRSILYNSDEPEVEAGRRKFAFILFDKRMHFYNLSKSLDSTQITISSDLNDPFIPFFEGLFADPEESRLAIDDALNNLEQLVNDNTLSADDEPCFSVALRTAMLALSEVGGGKITSVLSALPSWGPGSLRFKDNRSQAANISPEVQKKVYLPDSDYYKLLAQDFIKNNVGLDCLVVANTAVDLSNIGWLCSVSGGSVYRWTNFNLERDGRELSGRISGSVLDTKAYQAQLKLRCSSGLQVSQYYGTSSSVSEASILGISTQDPVIPTISEDKSFTVLLEYDGKLSTTRDCHFQAAVLHTDEYGQRKVRVINLVLAVSERLDDIFNFIDQDAVVTTIVRDTLSFISTQTFKELRESVNEKLVDVLTQYRAKSELGHNPNRPTGSQLLLPDSLVNLPIYLLSFLKSYALRESKQISADARLEDIFHMLNMPIDTLMYHLYPALVELHSLNTYEGLIPLTETNPLRFVFLPKFKELGLNKLEDGIYILCDGRRVLVWIRPNANPLLIKDVFGDKIDTIENIDAMMDQLPELDTEISEKARNIIKFFNQEINGLKTLSDEGIQIIREGIDGSDITFKDHLVEDGSKLTVSINNSSYPDFLSRLHKAIKVKLENDKSYSKVKQSLNTAENPETLAQRFIQF